ncbi:MAG: hypothetical protein K2Q25_09850 [Mycobacteriaceae bacterium]|nr:hypothetical protein [Mycobacteriaceae bacterium]
MPDWGRVPADQWGGDSVLHTDKFLDALAERLPTGFDNSDDQALAALLEEWRDELRWPPASALVAEEEAVEAVRSGVVARQRARRRFTVIGSVAAALLCFSGLGAVVVDARPGDALYSVHAMLFHKSRVTDDQIVLSAKAELAQVQQMIAQGQWDQAQDKLAAVSTTVQTVNDGTRKQDLIDEMNLLNTRVATRDPNATLVPSSPPKP